VRGYFKKMFALIRKHIIFEKSRQKNILQSYIGKRDMFSVSS